MIAAFALLAAASSAAAQQGGIANTSVWQPPIARTNSPPPPIISVPSYPGAPVYVPELARPYPPPGPPPPAPNIVRPPQPRQPAQNYVTPDDYPASALAQRAQGRVKVRLTVGVNGRVVGCAITRSSGFSILDSVTCTLLRRRARFTPAIDSNGQPAVGVVASELIWRLPR
jgi:periplasmic protein TonB